MMNSAFAVVLNSFSYHCILFKHSPHNSITTVLPDFSSAQMIDHKASQFTSQQSRLPRLSTVPYKSFRGYLKTRTVQIRVNAAVEPFTSITFIQ